MAISSRDSAMKNIGIFVKNVLIKITTKWIRRLSSTLMTWIGVHWMMTESSRLRKISPKVPETVSRVWELETGRPEIVRAWGKTGWWPKVPDVIVNKVYFVKPRSLYQFWFSHTLLSEYSTSLLIQGALELEYPTWDRTVTKLTARNQQKMTQKLPKFQLTQDNIFLKNCIFGI